MKITNWRRLITFLTLLVFTLGVVLLPGCGGAKNDKPEDVVRAFAEAWGKKDVKALNALMDEPSKDLEEGANIKEMLMKEDGMTPELAETVEKAIFSAKIEVGEAKVDGDNATVSTKVKAMDFEKIMESLFAELMTKVDLSNPPSDEEINKLVSDLFIQKLTDPKAASKETTVEVPLVKKDGAWKINSKKSDAFLTAVIGMGDFLGSDGAEGENAKDDANQKTDAETQKAG